VAGKILVVDDEVAVRDMITFTLSRAGFSYFEAGDAEEAEAAVLDETPDLILLDWTLPGRSGIEFAKHLRRDRATRSIPIIMITARREEEDKIRGLRTGADDFITKPFGRGELVARIEAVLRRTKPQATDGMVRCAGLVLDPKSHRVFVNEQILNIGPIEFRLLHLLMSNPDRAYSRAQILDLVWGTNLHVGERTVDMHVSNLRKALEPHGYGEVIQTVRGVGYRLSERR
jgi:two-component system phosphate regulon response regulator PhoB